MRIEQVRLRHGQVSLCTQAHKTQHIRRVAAIRRLAAGSDVKADGYLVK